MRPNDFEPRRSLTRRRRRGVASVLSMMFLVIFGSLAAAMAVVASGNVRTADVSLRVSRSTSAAETGLVYGTWILEREASRFVVRKGEIDAEFTAELWNGTYDTSTDGEVIVSPADGYVTSTDPSSLAEAVRDAHLAGDHGEIIGDGGKKIQHYKPAPMEAGTTIEFAIGGFTVEASRKANWIVLSVVFALLALLAVTRAAGGSKT